jgi:molybdopterin synthase catalytic subunit
VWIVTSAASTTPTGHAAGDRIRRCALSADPLDVPAILASVADPSAGGTDLFVGAVRNHDPHDGGRLVSALEYEAHPDALEVLRRVASEVASTPGVVAVAVEHRCGLLTVGDAAVVVAVSAAHRHEAFVACRVLIDTLKAEVPIWKRQWYADGASDWVGCA